MNDTMKLNLRHIGMVAAIAAAGFVLPASASADQARYTDRPVVSRTLTPVAPAYTPRTSSPYQYAQSRISYAQAKSIALRSRPGSKYIGMRLNGDVYVVRLETARGRVVDVRVDATTGRIR